MDIIEQPIDGELDLHTFRPEDAASVADEYLRACFERQIYEVRIIHGKGKGILRRIIHALLSRHPLVFEFTLDSGPSSWGATIVYLKKGTQSKSEEAGKQNTGDGRQEKGNRIKVD